MLFREERFLPQGAVCVRVFLALFFYFFLFITTDFAV